MLWHAGGVTGFLLNADPHFARASSGRRLMVLDTQQANSSRCFKNICELNGLNTLLNSLGATGPNSVGWSIYREHNSRCITLRNAGHLAPKRCAFQVYLGVTQILSHCVNAVQLGAMESQWVALGSQTCRVLDLDSISCLSVCSLHHLLLSEW